MTDFSIVAPRSSRPRAVALVRQQRSVADIARITFGVLALLAAVAIAREVINSFHEPSVTAAMVIFVIATAGAVIKRLDNHACSEG